MRGLEQRDRDKYPLAKNLVSWLNGCDASRLGRRSSKASRKRILNLLETVKQPVRAVSRKQSHIEGFTPNGFDLFLSDLSKRLAQYPVIQLFFRDENDAWSFTSTFSGARLNEEAVAAHGIVQLAQGGMLTRLLLCVCGKWFIAERSNQRSCSAGCRHKVYEQTDAFRERRRIYMREYYALRKTGKVK